MLEVRLLDDQRVMGDSGSLGPRVSARSLTLLAYLVVHAEAPQPRQHLAGLFWPDSTESQARTNLRRELHHLRRLIGDCPSLLVEPTVLTWRDFPACRVDVSVFEAERSAALAAESAGHRHRLRQHATAAITAYRGDLLPGCYDDWVLEHRDRLRSACVHLCDLAVDTWRETGDRLRAIAVARRRIELAPFEEVGYRALMELQAESGDRAAAVSTYHHCATVLEQELGLTPDRTTIAVMESLLARADGPFGLVPTTDPPRRIGAGVAHLVGRDSEFTQLLQHWQSACASRAEMVVVSGEAGVGKSRLVAELTARIRAEGAAWAVTRCFGVAGRLALAPVSEWLRGSELRPAAEALDPVWQTEVDRLVPGESGRDPGGAVSTETGPEAGQDGHKGGSRAMVDAWQRHRFFEGLARAVLGTHRPTLLVLDDLQWCDQETMDWITFLLGFAASAQLLVATTVRPDELVDNPSVAASLRSLQSAGLASELRLGPLSQQGSVALAESLLDRPLTTPEQQLLHPATGGYPLLVVESARSLAGATRASATPLSKSPGPPEDFSAVLTRRLQQPSKAAREVAGLAAALGRDFTLDLLCEASDLDADALVGAVDELWRLRILRELPGGYDFSHDLVREAAYNSVIPARRWLLHRRLAQGLELLHAGRIDGVAAQLAEQYDRGGRPDRALGHYRRAADAASTVYAYAEAIRHHRRCLALIGQMPPGGDRDRRELAELAAVTAPVNAVHGYSSRELQTVLERSVALAERLGDSAALVLDLVGLFCVRFVQGHPDEAHALATRALMLAETHPDVAGQAHFAYAGSAASLGMPAAAVPHFDLAAALSAGATSLIVGTRLEVHAQAWAAHAHWMLGDDAQARSRAAQAVTLARSVDHPYSLAVALAYAAITSQLGVDRPALMSTVRELSDLCARYEFAYYREWAPILAGWATGGERGIAQIQQGITRLRAQGSYARMPYWLSLQAEVMIEAGLPDAARGVLDGARAAAEQRAERWWLPEIMRLRASLEPGGARAELLHQAVALADEQSSPVLAARCRLDLRGLGVRAVGP